MSPRSELMLTDLERAQRLDEAWRSSRRHTLQHEATVSGVGAHSGRLVEVHLSPLDEPLGVVLNGVPLSEWSLEGAQWATTLSYSAHPGAHPCAHPCAQRVSTPEHLLAALYGAGVDDVLITLRPLEAHPLEAEALECPILDGSALPWLELIQPRPTGLRGTDGRADQELKQQGYPRTWRSLPSGEVRLDRCALKSEPHALEPARGPLSLSLSLSLASLYPELERSCEGRCEGRCALHQTQRVTMHSTYELLELIAPARTFGLTQHEAHLRALGLIKGVSEHNTLLLDERGAPLSPLRHPCELAAHKLLDALGDLALSGARWRGHLELTRGSHALNHLALSTLLR